VRVCIGICTCHRPLLLKKLLDGLAAQEGLDEVETLVVVVDNSPDRSAAATVEQAPLPVHYRHEIRRGIPMARNAVLAEATALNADWLVMIDDDQTVKPDTIAKFLLAAERDRADVVRGHVTYLQPEPRPFWCVAGAAAPEPSGPDGPLESRKRRKAATNGVMISARLFRPDGLNIRFNEALTCEEDGEFFARAVDAGALIVGTSEARLYEVGHRSRYAFRRVALNGLSRGGAWVTQYRSSRGYLRALLRYPGVAFARFAKGIGQFIIAPFIAPFSLRRFKFTALDAGKNICVAAGMLGALAGLQYNYYNTIDGC